MKDSDFDALKLTMSIVPEQVQWGEARTTHQIALHAAANEARAHVGQLNAAIAKIDADANLTAIGKRSARAKAAAAALADLEKSDTLLKARAAVAKVQKFWDERFGVAEIIKPAANAHEAMIYSKIIDRVAAMDASARMSFLASHAGDPTIASAVLLVPSFVSGLSETEIGVVRAQVEKGVIPADVLEERATTLKAMAACEKGWVRAQQLINERAGLRPEPVNLTEQARAKSAEKAA